MVLLLFSTWSLTPKVLGYFTPTEEITQEAAVRVS